MQSIRSQICCLRSINDRQAFQKRKKNNNSDNKPEPPARRPKNARQTLTKCLSDRLFFQRSWKPKRELMEIINLDPAHSQSSDVTFAHACQLFC